MVSILACLLGLFGIIAIAEVLWEHKSLQGEYQRKFVHVLAGTFIAFWPWLVSWRSIQIMSLAMVAVLLINRYTRVLNFMGGVKRISYGDILLAVSILLCAFLTHEKIFFGLAILEVALADGLAAAIGIKYGMGMKYKVFGHTKTVAGSLSVWIISLCVISVGALFAHNLIPFAGYTFLVLALSPSLMVVENVAVRGLDNIAIPLLVLGALHIAQNL